MAIGEGMSTATRKVCGRTVQPESAQVAIAVRYPLLAHRTAAVAVSVSVALHCIAVRIPIVLSSIRTPPFELLFAFI